MQHDFRGILATHGQKCDWFEGGSSAIHSKTKLRRSVEHWDGTILKGNHNQPKGSLLPLGNTTCQGHLRCAKDSRKILPASMFISTHCIDPGRTKHDPLGAWGGWFQLRKRGASLGGLRWKIGNVLPSKRCSLSRLCFVALTSRGGLKVWGGTTKIFKKNPSTVIMGTQC